MELPYYLMNPTGNRTLIVPMPRARFAVHPAARALLASLPEAEQGGIADWDGGDLPSLEMLGGEFCGNASMSAAALYYRKQGLRSPARIRLRVSGADEPVTVRVEQTGENRWQCCVNMPAPTGLEMHEFSLREKHFLLPVVHFPGISHILIAEAMERTDAEEAVRQWCAELGAAGLGLMFYDEKQASLTPLVYVPGIPTLCWESSCASGTTALGYYLRERLGRPLQRTFREPAGKLTVRVTAAGSLQLIGSTVLEREDTAVI